MLDWRAAEGRPAGAIGSSGASAPADNERGKSRERDKGRAADGNWIICGGAAAAARACLREQVALRGLVSAARTAISVLGAPGRPLKRQWRQAERAPRVPPARPSLWGQIWRSPSLVTSLLRAAD